MAEQRPPSATQPAVVTASERPAIESINAVNQMEKGKAYLVAKNQEQVSNDKVHESQHGYWLVVKR